MPRNRCKKNKRQGSIINGALEDDDVVCDCDTLKTNEPELLDERATHRDGCCENVPESEEIVTFDHLCENNKIVTEDALGDYHNNDCLQDSLLSETSPVVILEPANSSLSDECTKPDVIVEESTLVNSNGAGQQKDCLVKHNDDMQSNNSNDVIVDSGQGESELSGSLCGPVVGGSDCNCKSESVVSESSRGSDDSCANVSDYSAEHMPERSSSFSEKSMDRSDSECTESADIIQIAGQNEAEQHDSMQNDRCSQEQFESGQQMCSECHQRQLMFENLKDICCQQCLERLSEVNIVLQNNMKTKNAYSSVVLDEETADIYEVQMAALEKTITQLQQDVDVYRDKLSDQETASRNAIFHLKHDLGAKLDKAIKQLEATEKEKEAVVVKFAQSEATVLSLKKTLGDNDRKSKEWAREKEMFLNKIRLLTGDKVRLGQTLDAKCSEVVALQRDCDKLREDVTSKEIKIKWAQNKLKMEVDTHQETVSKLERTEHKLKVMREEAEQVRRDCQEMVRTYQESEEVRSNTLGIQLREKETELKQERQQKSNQEEVHLVIQQELDALKKKHKLAVDENNSITVKVQCLERERLDYEERVGKLKEQLNLGQQEIVDLQAKLVEMDNLMVQIKRQNEKIAMSQTEIERLRQSNAELQIDMEACRRKEGELLEFTERLTTKNVSLQSEYSCLEMKCQAQERELSRLTKLAEELEENNENLTSELTKEKKLRKQETEILARKLAEKTKAIENLNLKLDEQRNENKVLRRKNAGTIRELTREIQSLHRHLESYESSAHAENKSLGSRASSSNSLDRICVKDVNFQSSRSFIQPHVNEHLTEGFDNVISTAEPTQQMLIERIVKLQRAHARKNEKIEFLEEHVSQLLKELKKKSKLIHNYVMREETGTLSTSCMDQHKIEQSRRGGIMASLYTTQQVDGGLTLELSLEISRKLQAVLEDTLLKNITLKENIKTLGDEVARLSKETRAV